MAWIGTSKGLFRLHQSDQCCGSYLTVDDAAEVLEVSPSDLQGLPSTLVEGQIVISELDLHRAWGSGAIRSPQRPKEGNAKRSLDELILRKLLQITLPGCQVECQVPFGRKKVDLSLSHRGKRVFVEFVGPSHFIARYQRKPASPLARKKEVESHFCSDCIVWPFWIQRCSRNVLAMLGENTVGFASVWSTKALFGDFAFANSAQIILDLSNQFKAVRESGLGYMYGNSHATKPKHPIIQLIQNGTENTSRLIPQGNDKPESFWMPEELW